MSNDRAVQAAFVDTLSKLPPDRIRDLAEKALAFRAERARRIQFDFSTFDTASFLPSLAIAPPEEPRDEE